MAVKDSVLNFIIKAKNLAGDAISKFRKDVETLDSTSTDAGKSVDSLGTAADNLGKDVSNAGAKTKTLKDALSEINDKAFTAAEGMKKAEKEAADAARKLFETGVAADKVGASVGKMGQRFDAAGKPIETTRQEIKETNDELQETEDTSSKAGEGIGRFTKRLIALATAAVGINTVKNVLRDMLNTGDQFERLSLQMEQTMGSLAAGEQATAWVKDFARNTPLQLQEVTDTFLRMKNFGLDPLDGSMQAVVDQAAKLGKGYEAVEGISLALGQAWAKQKLQGEEIMQLVERGVPVWDLLAKVTGKNTAEIQKMSEAGQLNRDIIKAMIDEMGRQASGAAAQNMSLLSGYISNLKDEWTQFLGEVAESGALDYAKEQLRQLIQYIQELKQNGQLKEYAQNISDAFISVSEASKSVVLAIKDNISTIALLVKAYAAVKLAGFASDASKLAVTLGTTLVSSTTAAANATKTLTAAMRALPWVLVIDQAVKATQVYFDLQKAKQNLAASQATLTKVQADEIAKIKEFNEQTGLSVQSLNEIIDLRDAGSVSLDEYTGKWRLATDAIKEAEKAELEKADAEKKAISDRLAYKDQLDVLISQYDQVKEKSNSVSDAIIAVGQSAMKEGGGGLAALATTLQSVAAEGKATEEQLQNGLAKLLLAMNEEQYQAFGPGIIAALDKIKTGTVNTTVALNGMKKTISEDLATSANQLGIDIAKVLTGIDNETRIAIDGLTKLPAQLTAAGIKGEEANKVIKSGLLETLKNLDTSEEINATIAAINQMVAAQELSTEAAKPLLELLEKQRQVILGTADAQKTLSDANTQAAGTWTLIGDSSSEATQGMAAVGSATKWLQDEYAALRAGVEELGPAAVAAFDKLQGVNVNTSAIRGEFADLKQSIADASNEIDRMQKLSTATDFTGITRFLRDTAINAAAVKKEFAEQTLSIERLKSAYADGSITAQQFINATRNAVSSTSLLNQSDLSALKNQIKSAQEQMESFRESTLGTLNSLQSELANLQGNTERVAQLAFEARIADLNAALDEAKKTGDKASIAAAQESLRLAQEIYEVKKQQIAAEKQAAEQAKVEETARAVQEAADAAATQKQQNTQQQPQQQNNQQTGNVQRLEIALPSGRTANLSGSADDVNSLLDFLNEAGMRSAK